MDVIPPRLSFIEFVRWSCECFEEQASKEWADEWFKSVPEFTHEGDCTKEPYTCSLCLLEMFLEEYREYIFDYNKFIGKIKEES